MFKVNYDRMLNPKRNPKLWFAFFPVDAKMYYFFKEPIEAMLTLEMDGDHAANLGRLIAAGAVHELDAMEIVLRKAAVAPDDIPLPAGARLTVRMGDDDETILRVAFPQ